MKPEIQIKMTMMNKILPTEKFHCFNYQFYHTRVRNPKALRISQWPKLVGYI